jgi:hypothetical protein
LKENKNNYTRRIKQKYLTVGTVPKYLTVGTVPKSNRKKQKYLTVGTVPRSNTKMDKPNTQIHNRSLSWLGTGT